MPDPAQTEHANRIRTERALMRLTGASRSQIRTALLQQAKDAGFRQLQAQALRESFRPPPAPKVEVEEVKFEPNGLSEPSVGTGGTAATPPPEPPVMGEGVYTVSAGEGAVELIVDSGVDLTDTVTVKSLDAGDGIVLTDGSDVDIAVRLSTVYDKSIALTFATGEVYAEWFYTTTTVPSADYLSPIFDIDATDGAVFRSFVADNDQAIVLDVDGSNNFVLAWKAENIPEGTGTHDVYAGIASMTGAEPGVSGARFKKLKAGTGISLATSDANTIVIDATLVGGITQLIGDVTTPIDSTGNGVTATIANNAVTTAKINNAAVTMAKIAQAGATEGDVLTWNNTSGLWEPRGPGIPEGYEEVEVEMCVDGLPETWTILKKLP